MRNAKGEPWPVAGSVDTATRSFALSGSRSKPAGLRHSNVGRLWPCSKCSNASALASQYCRRVRNGAPGWLSLHDL